MGEEAELDLKPPFNRYAPTYHVQEHALQSVHGAWLCYRWNGWVYYPMPIYRPYEKGLRMGRFRRFREKVMAYEISIPYIDPAIDPAFFDEIVTWIGLRNSKWNFNIDSGGRYADRLVHFSFSDHRVAVEFTLRYSD
jgi:hypothetical protein